MKHWKDLAACKGADSNLFFRERGAPADEALKLCATCPVTAECLEYAITRKNPSAEFGIWGGLMNRQVREYRRKRLRQQQGHEWDCVGSPGEPNRNHYAYHLRRGEKACRNSRIERTQYRHLMEYGHLNYYNERLVRK